MSEIIVSFPAAHIAALKLFAGQADARSYLSGICLEIGPTEGRAIATDGSILGVFRKAWTEPLDIAAPLRSINIPNALLAHVKAKGLDVEFAIGEPDKTYRYPVRVNFMGVSAGGFTTEGIYPDYRRVIPSRASGDFALLVPENVARLEKARNLLFPGAKPKRLSAAVIPNGQGGALICLGEPDFTGVLMPYRLNAEGGFSKDAPAWVSDYLEAAESLV